jgi:hypothetical protein
VRHLSAALFVLLGLIGPAEGPRKAGPDPIPYFKGGKWGYCDAQKTLVIPAVYDLAGRFKDGRALVQQGKSKGFIDATGKAVVPVRYSHVEPFAEGLAAVGEPASGGGMRFGFVDRDGKLIVPLQYDWVNSFENGMAKIALGPASERRWGFVDSKGRVIVAPAKYSYVGVFTEGLAPAYEEHTIEIERFGFVDRDGREVISVSRYWSACHEHWSEGRMAIRHKGKWGYIDKSGHEVVPTKYDEAGDFENGRGHVKLDGKDLYLDLSGQSVPAPLTRRVEADGLAEIAVDGKRVFVDARGREVVKTLYRRNLDEVCPDWWLSEGLRGFTVDGKHGFLNRAGVDVIPARYDCTGQPSEGLIAVWQGRLAGFVDLTGKQVILFKYRKAEPFEDGLALVALPPDAYQHWIRGYVDKQGTEFFEGPGVF